MSADLILSALRSSPVLVGDCPEATVFDRSGLALPDEAGAISLDQKLGHIYEDGLAALLEKSECYDLLEKSLQIQSDKHRTLGELDFLLRDRTSGAIIHLELAVKFYLAVESADGHQLPGPDARDNYDKKLKRLRSHQLTLVQQFREHLPVAYRDEPITTRQLVIGSLFDHISAAQPAQAAYLRPNARRGKWLHQHELIQHFPAQSPYIIPKHLWPVEVNKLPSSSLEPLDTTELLDRCVMVHLESEPMPLFIAPDAYPGV
ncbi:DUF1853 family protein [Verrucomicrobiaceae bacterium R5-34]|nr:DUF1853 family protein [Verrucomicrobiaceae bacterium R5-34]